MKNAPYQILYEDEEILVVYKQRDVFSIRTKDKKTFSHNLYHYLYLYLKEKGENLFVVHRLDYETSGVMIFAKSKAMKEKLQKCFEDRKVERYYEAVIKEKIELGTKHDVLQYLSDGENGTKVQVVDEKTGKDAITHIQAHNYIQIGTALNINIETGRRNQIRIALYSLGYTLLGDKRYSNNENKRMYLNSYALVFPSNLGLKENEFITKPLWLA
jgi:23S rRNA pseudouridine1911/1915/1917 synthase